MTVTLLNNRYALTSSPRVGGMSDVYRATDLLHDDHRPVAVKIFRYGAIQEEILRESFRRETMALRELIHENIVQLVDAGNDEKTGHLFVITEWIEYSLPDWLKEHPLSGWDDYYQSIGRSLLAALYFAHLRRFTHRDLKPTNILVNNRGVAKLADFGLAKLHAFMKPGITLSEFISRPYSPPEPDEGVHAFSRDLYGFAALTLSCFSDVQLTSREDLEQTLATASLPDDVCDVLSRCLSLDPALRPMHAGELQAELDMLEKKRTQAQIPSRILYLTLPTARFPSFRRTLGTETDHDMARRVKEELCGPCGIEPYLGPTGSSSTGERHYALHCSTLSFHARVEEDNRLMVSNFWQVRPGDCERNRERSWPLPFLIQLKKPPDPEAGAETIRQLDLAVAAHQAELREKEVERREQHLFDSWANLLKARAQYESDRNPPINYDYVTEQGDRVRLSILAPVSEDIAGQAWKISVPNGPPVRGEIEEVLPDAILFRPAAALDAIPRRGILRFDAWAAEQAIDRQKIALEAVRLDRAVKGNLRKLLLHPAECRQPSQVGELTFVRSDLDEAKRKAVLLGLGVEDLLLVEGPPGTGKTTFIAELVLQYLRLHPDHRILLASQTHVALDNAIERLKAADKNLRVVRIAGRFTSGRVSEGVRDCLLDHQLERWRHEALEAGRKYLHRWSAAQGISQQNLETIELLIELRALLDVQENLRTQHEEISKQLAEASDEFQREELAEDQRRLKHDADQIVRRIKDLEKRLKKIEDLASEFVKLKPTELDYEITTYLPPTPVGRMARQLVEHYAQWEIRFGRTPDFAAALLVASQVVAGTCIGMMGVKGSDAVEYDLCIVDEASKATPTELLVPLSRARRCIVVGDPRQLSPFQEPEFKTAALAGPFGLSEDDLEVTLFDHLVMQMPEECRVTLTVQHRMVKPIGDLISTCFYDGSLDSPRIARPSPLDGALPKRIIWLSTSRLAQRAEQGQVSLSNPTEAREIAVLLKRIAFLGRKEGSEYSVAVLSGYSDQRRHLERMIQAEGTAWNGFLRVEVNTVDAFQGREADIAIYSITRSNAVGRVGFLAEHERINVALSRGREFLIIVGDHAFCRQIKGENALKKILDYVEAHPDTCLLSEVQP